MNPTITIAMPIYNGAGTVARAISSLLDQTFTDFELIASDNCSTDDTLAIVMDMARSDSRLRVLTRRRTTGAAEHFNDLFWLRRGTYFMWAACDDLWQPEFVEQTHQLLLRHPEAVAALTQIAFIDKMDTVFRINSNMAATSMDIVERIRTIFNRTGWFALFGLMRADVVARTQLYRRSFGGDVLFMAELLLHGTFAIVNTPLFHYRMPQPAKSASEYQHAIDPSQPLSREPYSELAREVLNIVRLANLCPATIGQVEAMAIEELSFNNAHWRSLIAQEQGVANFDGVPASARTNMLSGWLQPPQAHGHT